MKISRFRTRLLDVPGKYRYHVVTHLESPDGATGFGYVKTARPGQARARKELADDLGEQLAGKELAGPAEMWAAMHKLCYSVGFHGASLQAMAGIDAAAWDMYARGVELPLYEVLGGARSRVRAYASHALARGAGPDQLARAAQDAVAQGWSAMKMRVGGRDPLIDFECVRAVREAVGPAVDVMADVNWNWTAAESVRFGRQLEPYDLYWLEDPTPEDDAEGMAHVRASLRMPITACERLESVDQFRRFLSVGAVDIIMIDLQHVGGVTPWLRIADLAHGFGIPVAGHAFPDWCSHLLCAVPNALILEYFPHWDVLYKEGVQVDNGWVTPSSKPGLGLEPDEAQLQKFALA
jgi:L-alanine-DL-glutamate epimerase-like enolase superfamily enzyme